jgi:glycosyltransferase involved in cell wall biosynthesis
MKRLSVVIPVYNGEKCLPRLVESLQNQNIPKDDYELLFVDDCSTDGSVGLIKQFANLFPNIKLYRHEVNRRLATSCNTGIDNALGAYIWIVDQDDWIEPDSMDFLLQKAENQRLDLLLFNYKRVGEDGKTIKNVRVFEDSEVQDGKSFINTYFATDFDSYLLGYRWRTLLSKEFLRNNNIRFIDGMMYDDTTILLKSIVLSNKMASTSRSLYNYCIYESSITYSKAKKGDRIFEFAFLVGKEVEDFSKKLQTINTSWGKILVDRAKRYYNSFIIDLLRTSKVERKRFYELVKKKSDVVCDIKAHIKFIGRLLLMPFLGQFLVECMSFVYKKRHGIK